MKPHKSTILIVLLGLLLAVFAIGVAQSSSQTDQAKRSEASPSMDSCCCKGGSCPMKKGASATDTKDGCCCCSGSSCDMKMNHSMEKPAGETGDSCCGGDSCDVKMKEKMKNHTGAEACGCCSGDHNAMKTNETMSSQSSAHECCCSMKMKHKNMQHMKMKH